MSILITLLTFVEVLVCLFLILIILMQRPRQEGLGASFGTGVMEHLAGAQTTNVLQKGTSWLCGLMFATTVILATLVSHQGPKTDRTLFKGNDKPAAAEAPPAAGAPAVAPAAVTPAPATNGPAMKLTPGAPATSPVITVQPEGAAGTTTQLPNGGTVTVKPGPASKPAEPTQATPAPAATTAPAPSTPTSTPPAATTAPAPSTPASTPPAATTAPASPTPASTPPSTPAASAAPATAPASTTPAPAAPPAPTAPAPAKDKQP